MASNESNNVVGKHYRAVGEGGLILAEGDDVEEVLIMSRGQMVDLLVQTERRIVSTWTQMPKNELSHLRKMYYQ